VSGPDGKILHVCENIQGGIATYLNEVGPLQIAERGPGNVRFVIPARSRADLPDIPDECIVPIDYERRSARALSSYMLKVRRILADQRPGLVHAHSTFAGLATRLLRARGVSDAPLVYCAHGWSFLMDVSPLKRRAYAAIERRLARHTDAIVNISHYEHERALELGLPADKSHIVVNGIGPAPDVRPAALPQSRINLLFSGRMDRQKGLDILLAAMERLGDRDVHLYVAGAAVLARATQRALPNVTYLGWLARDALESYYAAADALVVPSRWEGFGLVATEAMRRSTAVIASDRGALPEIVVSGETGLIYSGDDPDRLASALRGPDKATLKRWGLAGRARQRALFSIDRVHSQLNEIYAALAEREAAAQARLVAAPIGQ
jgi:glycosyltransferase involved in cell wall biosynthesis